MPLVSSAIRRSLFWSLPSIPVDGSCRTRPLISTPGRLMSETVAGILKLTWSRETLIVSALASSAERWTRSRHT